MGLSPPTELVHHGQQAAHLAFTLKGTLCILRSSKRESPSQPPSLTSPCQFLLGLQNKNKNKKEGVPCHPSLHLSKGQVSGGNPYGGCCSYPPKAARMHCSRSAVASKERPLSHFRNLCTRDEGAAGVRSTLGRPLQTL